MQKITGVTKTMTNHNAIRLKRGTVLKNDDIVKLFKCSPQGGMRKSIRTNTLVLVSNHLNPIYTDKAQDDVIHYMGTGQQGDQSFDKRQNKTLFESAENGVEVHLFEIFKKREFTYAGRVQLSGTPWMETHQDVKDKDRLVCMFPLKVIEQDDDVIKEHVVIEEPKQKPTQVTEVDITMYVTKENHEDTVNYLATQPSSFEIPRYLTPAGYRLLVASDKTIRLVWGRDDEAITTYKVEIKPFDMPNAFEGITLSVWRHIDGRYTPAMQGLNRELFDHLLTSKSIVIDEHQQNDLNRQFWLDRIGESLHSCVRSVYYVDMNRVDEHGTPFHKEINNMEEFITVFMPKGWGPTRPGRVFVIA